MLLVLQTISFIYIVPRTDNITSVDIFHSLHVGFPMLYVFLYTFVCFDFRNPYYGELEATHSLNNILDYDKVHTERLSAGSKVDGSEDEISINLQCDGSPSISNLSYQTYSLRYYSLCSPLHS